MNIEITNQNQENNNNKTFKNNDVSDIVKNDYSKKINENLENFH